MTSSSAERVQVRTADEMVAPGPEGAWSTACAAASSLAPPTLWRRRLAGAIRDAAGAVCASVMTCPPDYWLRLQHDTVPPRYDSLIHRINAEFVPRIERSGESWRYAIERFGAVYAPLEEAEARQLADDLTSSVLAPAGIAGWIVAWFMTGSGHLVGFAVVGTEEPARAALPRLSAPLAEVGRRAAWTLQMALELARGCGVILPELAPDRAELTPREHQIADLIARGYSNANVAAHLGIAANTVGVHLQRIYRKLGVHTRIELGAAMSARGQGEPVT